MQASVHPARTQRLQLFQGSPLSSPYKGFLQPGCDLPRGFFQLELFSTFQSPSVATTMTPGNRADNDTPWAREGKTNLGRETPGR